MGEKERKSSVVSEPDVDQSSLLETRTDEDRAGLLWAISVLRMRKLHNNLGQLYRDQHWYEGRGHHHHTQWSCVFKSIHFKCTKCITQFTTIQLLRIVSRYVCQCILFLHSHYKIYCYSTETIKTQKCQKI